MGGCCLWGDVLTSPRFFDPESLHPAELPLVRAKLTRILVIAYFHPYLGFLSHPAASRTCASPIRMNLVILEGFT